MFSSRKSNSIVGFTRISYGISSSSNKPYLDLGMDDTAENRAYLLRGGRVYGADYIVGGQLFNAMGDINYSKRKINIHIEGKSSVACALKFLQNEAVFHNYSEEFKNDLKAYKKNVLELIGKKKFKPALISKKRSDYCIKYDEDIYTAHKDTKIFDNYIYKRARNLRKSQVKATEVEASAAAFYRLFMGHEHVPKTFVLYDEPKLEIAGLISKKINGFCSAEDYFENFEDPIPKEDIYKKLIRGGFVPMAVASYVFGETDLHHNNWGLNRNSKVVRMDFNRSFWVLSSKYFDRFPHEMQFFKNQDLSHLQVKPIDTFKFSVEELVNFPNLSTSKPHNWITGTRYCQMQHDISDINKADGFEEQKWKYFLKATIISKSVIETIFTGFMSEGSTRNKFINYMSERITELEATLLATPEFNHFLLENKHVIDEIMIELKNYNLGVKDKYASLRINLANAEEKLNSILLQVKKLNSPTIGT